MLSGILGLAFLYSQARILAANKGIPSWRHPRSIALMIATGLAEGGGFLACVVSFGAMPIGPVALVFLVVLIAVRAWFWRSYLAGLVADGAPEGALRVLTGFAPRFVSCRMSCLHCWSSLALAGVPGRAALVFAAGLMMVAGGWMLKFTLVRRAAFTQGLALLCLPVRGGGPAGPAVKPGWKAVAGT
jgi:phenylacetyl-CoA:acceptor oxidoreductase subunit 2